MYSVSFTNVFSKELTEKYAQKVLFRYDNYN